MSWTLVTGANTVTMEDPDQGYEAWTEKSQAVGFTAAGETRVYDKDVPRYRLRVSWSDISDSDKEDLATFFDNASGDVPAGVDGALGTFTLTDEDATDYTSRFLEPELRFTKRVNNRWNVTVLLETDALVTT